MDLARLLTKALYTASRWSERTSFCRMCLQGMQQKGGYDRPMIEVPIKGRPQEVLQRFQGEYDALLRNDAEPRLTCCLCQASMYWEGETVYITTHGYIRPTMEINNRLYFRNHLGGPGQEIKREELPVDWPMELAEFIRPASPASSLGSLGEDILDQFGDDSGMDEGEV